MEFVVEALKKRTQVELYAFAEICDMSTVAIRDMSTVETLVLTALTPVMEWAHINLKLPSAND